MLRARTWILIGFINLLLSVSAVAIIDLQPSNPVLAGLYPLAERFASPGELLWWATLGGTFAGYPSGWSGIALWVLGTALFWLLVSAPIVILLNRCLAGLRKERR